MDNSNRLSEKARKFKDEISTGKEIRWEEITTKPNDENIERYFNKIELTRENIMKNFDDIKYKLLV